MATATAPTCRRRQRQLITKNGEIGTLKAGGNFQSYTNFCIEVLHAVKSPPDAPALFGFVYVIKTTDSHSENCFVSVENSQTLRSFVKEASKSHPFLQCARISDTLWGLYVLSLNKAYAASPNYTVKTLVSRVGRQPKSEVWVFNPDVQVDQNGEIIPFEKQSFYWHTGYMMQLSTMKVVPLPVCLPLSACGLSNLLRIAKKCLGNNFVASFLTIAGCLTAFHYEALLELQDECPMILCYSKESGTGKSSSLNNALSLFGAHGVHINGPDTPPAAVVGQAAYTTVPLGLDDISSGKKLESIAVQFFNGFSHCTLSQGIKVPRTTVIVTANQSFCSTQRNCQRIVHIPFFPPDRALSPRRQLKLEGKLKKARSEASSSIGVMVGLGHRLKSQSVQRHTVKEIMPLIIKYMPSLHLRVQKSYGQILTAAKMLCAETDIIHYEEVQQFFLDHWAPIVTKLHAQGGGVIEAFFANLLEVLEPLTLQEVLQMVRSNVKTMKNGPSVGLYIPMVREHLDGYLTSIVEKKVKDAVKDAGGLVNHSGLFLSTTSTASSVTKASGVNRRSVMLLPRDKVSADMLEKLDHICNSTAERGLALEVGLLRVSDECDAVAETDLQERGENKQEGEGDAASQVSSSDEDDQLNGEEDAVSQVSSSDDGEGDAVSQGLSEQKSFEEEDGNELDAALEENHDNVETHPLSLALASAAVSPPIECKEMTFEHDDICWMGANCHIENYKGKNIRWVQCDMCDEWVHLYCTGRKRLPKSFVCNMCTHNNK